MENVSLQIHNYKYSDKQIKEVENKIHFLIKQLPFSSRVLLDFDYKNKVFYGKIRVDLDGTTFFATADQALLGTLTTSLCKKIQKQVMKWKKRRTVEDITGIIALPQTKKDQKFNSYKKAS